MKTQLFTEDLAAYEIMWMNMEEPDRPQSVAYPGILFGVGDSTNSFEDRTDRAGIWGR